ncbi:Tat pathway signal protein [Haloferax sp. MBLA0076]|uniref:Tat pathway signal protein n=2 Tax=Haloferacaceae TaxID=1644056 RepID=A0A6A8GBT0_9EURY|nr:MULTISPECIES: Tat pathway signal protein [Haloferax]KAB1192051.1 Tat pathway signal protein [Haloferax sp. CBA1148]MRX20495.1 Tat pathway signal protein [Haloferax litoreum]
MTKDTFSTSRRSILRLGVLSAAGIGIGIPAVSGSAAATVCPKTPGYWANRAPDSEWEPLFDGSETYNMRGVTKDLEGWREFLLAPTKGDKAHIMAKHRLATLLNLRNRPGDDQTCSDANIRGTDYTIQTVKNNAGAWLDATDWANYGETNYKKQRSWTVDGMDGETIKDTLDAFNNDPSSLGLYCPCDD